MPQSRSPKLSQLASRIPQAARGYRKMCSWRSFTCARPLLDPDHDLSQYDIVTSMETRMLSDGLKDEFGTHSEKPVE